MRLRGNVKQVMSLIPLMLSRKRYAGSIPHLRGKTAFIRPRVGNSGQVMAQFEELHLQEARGWWQFAASRLCVSRRLVTEWQAI